MSSTATRRSLFKGRFSTSQNGVPGKTEIVSLIVNVFPQHLAGVARMISTMPGAQVHATDHKGKLIVVLEAATDGDIGAMANDISGLPHVLSAAMVFQATDEATS